MVAQVPTVAIYAGDSALWPVYTIKTPENTARDLAAEGWNNWKAQWRAAEGSDIAIELTVDASRANEGMIILSATAEQTAAMGGAGVFDIQSARGSEVKTWVRGKTKYTKDITRG
jgi:hypothetical protein